MHRLFSFIAAATLLVSAGTLSATEKPDYLSLDVGANAIATGSTRGTLTEVVTGFEAPDFLLGPIFGNNGWGAVGGSSLLEGHIDTANPSAGGQHLRISEDAAIGAGANGIFTTSAFSPIIVPLASGPSQVSVNVAIGATGGADYRIQPQSVGEGFLTAIMQFSFLGDILVLNDALALVDSGIDWTPGPYVEARIEVDPDAGTVEYFYDGVSIFLTGIIAGTTIDNVIMGGDNFNLGESGDFDELRFPSAAPIPPTEVPALGPFGLLGLLLTLAMVGVWKMRSA